MAGSLEQRRFALTHLYVYPRLRIAYTYIPKNACTSFKATFGHAQGWLTGPSAHEMHTRWWLSGLARYRAADERIVVLRDPFDRVLSAYLNRFLMRRRDEARDHAMGTGLAGLLADGAGIDAVRFADFVEYLSRTPDRDLNEHWRPQSSFLVGSYTRRIRFDHIAEDTAFLTARGLPLEQRKGHATSAVRSDLGPGWGQRRAGQLRRMRVDEKVLPLAENMYDDELRAAVAARYAEDVELVAALGVGT